VYDPTDILNLNFKYLSECVAALADTVEKGTVVKDKEKVTKEFSCGGHSWIPPLQRKAKPYASSAAIIIIGLLALGTSKRLCNPDSFFYCVCGVMWYLILTLR